MKKKNYCGVNLHCVMQKSELSGDKCANGVLSVTPFGFRFEEAVRDQRPAINPKLFEGKYISLTRAANGKYRCFFRQLTDEQLSNPYRTAERVYDELLTALNLIG